MEEWFFQTLNETYCFSIPPPGPNEAPTQKTTEHTTTSGIQQRAEGKRELDIVPPAEDPKGSDLEALEVPDHVASDTFFEVLELKYRKAQLQAEIDQMTDDNFLCVARERHCLKLMEQFGIPILEPTKKEDIKDQELVTELDRLKLDIKSKVEQKIRELKIEEREKQYLAWYEAIYEGCFNESPPLDWKLKERFPWQEEEEEHYTEIRAKYYKGKSEAEIAARKLISKI